jgi:hypothetical protein
MRLKICNGLTVSYRPQLTIVMMLNSSTMKPQRFLMIGIATPTRSQCPHWWCAAVMNYSLIPLMNLTHIIHSEAKKPSKSRKFVVSRAKFTLKCKTMINWKARGQSNQTWPSMSWANSTASALQDTLKISITNVLLIWTKKTHFCPQTNLQRIT